MRRGINIRKKKKIVSDELNKKSLKLLALLIILLIICILIYSLFIQDFFVKTNLEKDNIGFSELNSKIPFSLRKIILFSSATAETGSINQLLSLDVSSYCDIGIYLNQFENVSISSLYIDNISISSPELGTPYLYKKVVSDLGKCSFNENNIINDRFDFNIISTENEINYNNYEFYCDGSTPISLGFYNKNIKTDFMPEGSEILYNGTLLKQISIPLNSINTNISFTLNIITTTNEHYICNINFDIPYEDSDGLIYNTGYTTKEFQNNETNKFIRIK